MLRLMDAKTAKIREVSPAQSRIFRLKVRGGTRAYVVGDLIRRVADRRHWRVVLDSDAGKTDLTERQLLDLNVHPGDGPIPGGEADLEILLGKALADKYAGCTLRVAAMHANAELHMLESSRADGLDPLALRLALLAVPYEKEAASGRESLAAADSEIQAWRGMVAQWAEAESAPMAATYVDEFVGALGDDLDVPGALTVLRRLSADDTVAPGSRFETFAHLDRLLGLDLARDVGRARAEG